MSTTPQPEGQSRPEAPPTAQIVRPTLPPMYAPPPRRSWLGRILVLLLTLAFCGSILLNLFLLAALAVSLGGGLDTGNRVQEKFVSHNSKAEDKIAIIPVEGIILEAEDGFVKHAIDQVMKDKDVKAVVLRVDSPGGSVSGADYIYYHLRKLVEKREIPLVVSMGGIAASGGYYISMAVGDTPDTIFAEPTTFTGSIGVIIPHYDLSELLEKKLLIRDDSIVSDPLKEAGNMTKRMTTKERAIFQALVDDGLKRFKDIVKSGRPKFRKDSAALDKLATGRIYTADQAKPGGFEGGGLIDKIGFLEDAVDRAIVLTGLDKKDVKVVRYKPEIGLTSILMGGEARSKQGVDLKALMDMTTPRAYYLSTWLPGLGTGQP